MRKILRAGLGALLAFGCAPVLAATATTTFTVTATVAAACTVSATDLAFGTYSTVAAGPPLDATSTVTTTCTLTVPYNIGLSAGTGTGASVATRKMTSGANLLTYSLFQDVSRSTLWGVTIGTDTVALTGTGLAAVTTVYGRVPGAQNVPVGSYTDTITATLTF